jgi:ABC-type siderophore export system fused ATPase/permease subunit
VQKFGLKRFVDLEDAVKLAGFCFVLGILILTTALLMDSGACPRWITAWCAAEDVTELKHTRPIFRPLRAPSDES